MQRLNDKRSGIGQLSRYIIPRKEFLHVTAIQNMNSLIRIIRARSRVNYKFFAHRVIRLITYPIIKAKSAFVPSTTHFQTRTWNYFRRKFSWPGNVRLGWRVFLVYSRRCDEGECTCSVGKKLNCWKLSENLGGLKEFFLN